MEKMEKERIETRPDNRRGQQASEVRRRMGNPYDETEGWARHETRTGEKEEEGQRSEKEEEKKGKNEEEQPEWKSWWWWWWWRGTVEGVSVSVWSRWRCEVSTAGDQSDANMQYVRPVECNVDCEDYGTFFLSLSL